MNYKEIAEAARGHMGPWCKACPVCDGRACGAHLPGPGAKGSGTVAMRNRNAWEAWRLNMDTIQEPFSPDASTVLFGRRLSLPVMIAPVGDVKRHYSDELTDLDYNGRIMRAAAAEGTVAWTGDGLRPEVMTNARDLIGQLDGAGVPTVKPWGMDVVFGKLQIALENNPFAVAMDIDGAGLPFLKVQASPAGPKSVAQLSQIADACHQRDVPFVLKGIMTEAGALKALEAGVDGIVVSNHGGRVLDGVPATAEVLPRIVDAVDGRMSVLVDGGIRSGVDVFRALALGADAVLIARPFVVAAYGAGEDGVRAYLAQLRGELEDAMQMCGTPDVRSIGRGNVVRE